MSRQCNAWASRHSQSHSERSMCAPLLHTLRVVVWKADHVSCLVHAHVVHLHSKHTESATTARTKSIAKRRKMNVAKGRIRPMTMTMATTSSTSPPIGLSLRIRSHALKATESFSPTQHRILHIDAAARRGALFESTTPPPRKFSVGWRLYVCFPLPVSFSDASPRSSSFCTLSPWSSGASPAFVPSRRRATRYDTHTHTKRERADARI